MARLAGAWAYCVATRTACLTLVAVCPLWAYEQDYRFPSRLKRFGYITLRYFSIGFDWFFRLWSFPHTVFTYPNSLYIIHSCSSPLRKCNNLRDRVTVYILPDLWSPNSPDLNPIDYKICGIIQQRIQSTKVQDVNDLMLRLWLMRGLEWKRASFKITVGACMVSPYLHSATGGKCHNIHCDKKINI